MTSGDSSWKWWVERSIGVLAAGSGVAAWIAMSHPDTAAGLKTSAATSASAAPATAPQRIPTSYRAAHVLVSWAGATDSMQTRSKAEARARIEEVKARLAAGEAFEALAGEYGDDATRARGGDLGVIQLGFFPKVIDDAVLALAPGQVSGVVETRFGYHLMKRLK